jgi:hypothetical protein
VLGRCSLASLVFSFRGVIGPLELLWILGLLVGNLAADTSVVFCDYWGCAKNFFNFMA